MYREGTLGLAVETDGRLLIRRACDVRFIVVVRGEFGCEYEVLSALLGWGLAGLVLANCDGLGGWARFLEVVRGIALDWDVMRLCHNLEDLFRGLGVEGIMTISDYLLLR